MLLVNFILGYYLTILALILIMVALIITFKENKIVQFIGLISIIAIIFYAKSEWGYLLLIIYIALKFNLIDSTFLDSLNKLKQSWEGKYKTENLNNQDKQQKENATFNEIQRNVSTQTPLVQKDILIRYEKSEESVINWFALNTKLIFDKGKKIFNKKKNVICPDGIFETNSNISILEVKRGFEKSDNISLFKQGLETLIRTKDFYNDSSKSIDLYLAFVFDSKNYNMDKLNQYFKTYTQSEVLNNCHIYLFKQEENEIKFIEKITF